MYRSAAWKSRRNQGGIVAAPARRITRMALFQRISEFAFNDGPVVPVLAPGSGGALTGRRHAATDDLGLDFADPKWMGGGKIHGFITWISSAARRAVRQPDAHPHRRPRDQLGKYQRDGRAGLSLSSRRASRTR